MNLQLGHHVLLTAPNGSEDAFTVTAIRHYPVDFVEVSPRHGGPKRTLRTSELWHVDGDPEGWTYVPTLIPPRHRPDTRHRAGSARRTTP